MKVYLSARYDRHQEMRLRRCDVEDLGHTVTSRWIEAHHEMDDTKPYNEWMAHYACEDLDDLTEAEWLILFTEDPTNPPRGASTGGRHVEFGMALREGKRLTIIGPQENIFHWLPFVEQYPDWQTFLSTQRVVEHV